MQPQVVFFDIDGTLIDFAADAPSERVVFTLRALQERGTRIVVATGRAPTTLPQIGSVSFDAFLTMNGSYCYTPAGDVIRSAPIPPLVAKRVVANATSIGRPVCAATKDGLIANGTDQDMVDFFAFSGTEVPVNNEFDAVLENEEIFQFMIGARAPEHEALIKGTPEVKILAWWNRAVDIIPVSGGKAAGVRAVCSYFDADPADAAAFGDGRNDADMIAAVGLGVAMGNARPEVKAVADAIAPPVTEDGVYYFSVEQGWI